MTLLTSIGNFKVFIPLLFFLFLAACTHPTPQERGNPEETPIDRPWEQLPHIDMNLIQPAFYTTVNNTSGAIDPITINFDTVKTGAPIIFRPATGNFDFLSDSSRSMRHTIAGVFTLPVKVDPTSRRAEAHLYLNGGYEPSQTTIGPVIGNSHSYYLHVRPEADSMQLTDTWYFILVFQGTDGKDYQYRTPVMSVANAL